MVPAVSDTAFPCDSTSIGAIRYNTGTAAFEDCNGVAWADIRSGAIATAAAPAGSVQFNSGGLLGGSANFTWDKVNNRLGIGTNTPGALLDVGLAGTTLGTMRLESSTAASYVQIQPSTTSGSWTMTLPATAGTNNYVLSTNGSGVTSWVANGSGSGTPAGSDKQIQFNSSGAFGANSSLTFDRTTNTLATPIVSAATKLSLGLTAGTAAPSGLKLSLLGDTGIASPSNGQCLTYNGTVWVNASCSGSGGTTWNAITNPTGNLSLTMGANTSLFTYNATTGANDLFKLTDTAANTGTGYLLNITTAASSTLKPFHISVNNGGTDALTVLANGQVGIGNTTPGAMLDIGKATAAGSLRIEGNTSGYVGFQSPAAPTSVTYTLPTGAPGTAGWVLSSDTSGNMSWVANGGGVRWDQITNPTANQALTMAANISTWTYNAATGAGANLFNITDTTNNTGTGSLLNVTTASGSAAAPLHLNAKGATDLVFTSAGRLGMGTATPGTALDVNGGVTMEPASVTLTANNTVLATANRSYFRVTSDNTTATNRIFCFGAGTIGQIIIIEWTSTTNKGEIVKNGNCGGAAGAVTASISFTQWAPNAAETILQLMYNGTHWIQIAGSANY